jgi:plastocyanin
VRNATSVRRFGIASVVLTLTLVGTACGSGATDGSSIGSWNVVGPDTFPCGSAPNDGGYTRYGVGPMRRGGWEREELEPDHVVIDGQGVNLHGTGVVADGATIELEMDEDYFEPTVLKGPAGATVTIELHNDGTRAHNFFVPGQGIDLHCGVRAEDQVQVVFPRSGVLVYRCRYTATSGMRGALRVAD